MTGAPKISAQQGIADLEAEPRGAYTGSIGLVSPLAGADFNVIIRTFELQDGRAGARRWRWYHRRQRADPGVV